MGFSRKYDRSITESEEGKRLYVYWYKKVHRYTDSPEFQTYPGFYTWAMEAGYTPGAKLIRYNPGEPFSPDNCTWIPLKYPNSARRDPEREKQWDDVVNRIRIHYGLEPIHSTPTEVEDCG
jgi:hypothetical protein